MHAEITVGRPGHTRLTLDGHDITNAVSGFTLQGRAKDLLPELTVELRILDRAGSTVAGDVQVVLPPATVDALTVLGWTPPGHDDSVQHCISCRCDQ